MQIVSMLRLLAILSEKVRRRCALKRLQRIELDLRSNRPFPLFETEDVYQITLSILAMDRGIPIPASITSHLDAIHRCG